MSPNSNDELEYITEPAQIIEQIYENSNTPVKF